MTSDSIGQILNDATMSPKAYCMRYDCGQGIYDELADYVPDMCIHLIGRTEAVVRHNMLFLFNENEKGELHIGDRIMRDNGHTGTIIGYAMGKDNKPCLVLSMHGSEWKTYLCPISEAHHLKVPTIQELKNEILLAMQEAADGSDFTAEKAESRADFIADMAHAHFTRSEFPMRNKD